MYFITQKNTEHTVSSFSPAVALSVKKAETVECLGDDGSVVPMRPGTAYTFASPGYTDGEDYGYNRDCKVTFEVRTVLVIYKSS